MKIFLTTFAFVGLVVLAGCAGMWAAKEQELLNQGYTQQEVDKIVGGMQVEIAEDIGAIKNAMIDAAPIPGPKEPIKGATDYWLEALLVAIGVLSKGTYDKVKKSPEGKLLG